MKLSIVSIDDLGGAPFCKHNYPCPIYSDLPAVRIMGRGYFQPSWKAQDEGWRIIRIDNRIQELLIRVFFKDEFDLCAKNLEMSNES